MLSVGRVDTCWWSVVKGPLTDHEFATFTAHLCDVARSDVSDRVVLDLLFDSPMPDASRRRQLVSAIEGGEFLDRCAGHALVVNSKVGQALLTTINWFVPPVFDERIFTSPREGAKWLSEKTPKFDAELALTTIGEECPEFKKLRWTRP